MTTTDREPTRVTEAQAAAIAAGLAGLAEPAPQTMAPGVYVAIGQADYFARIDGPIGTLVVAWNGRGVSLVDAEPDDAAFIERHRGVTGRPAYPAADGVPAHLAQAIRRRLDGDARIRIDLDLRGHTDFERDVWRKALEIPHGEVRPYGWIAAEIGRPRAVRAVGTALGHNPVPLIVPCHRVVRTDGTIGQYSLGGPGNKRTILRSEGLDPDELERLAAAGTRYLGSDTTGVVCLPTCRHARRITERHRVSFRSFRAAEDAGYRACRVCRPDSGATIAA